MDDRIEIHFEYRLMLFQFQCFAHRLEMKTARPFYQNKFPGKPIDAPRLQEHFGRGIKLLLYIETSGMRHNFITDSDETLHPLMPDKRSYALIKFIGRNSRL